jgi:hypothetical protein
MKNKPARHKESNTFKVSIVCYNMPCGFGEVHHINMCQNGVGNLADTMKTSGMIETS